LPLEKHKTFRKSFIITPVSSLTVVVQMCILRTGLVKGQKAYKRNLQECDCHYCQTQSPQKQTELDALLPPVERSNSNVYEKWSTKYLSRHPVNVEDPQGYT
jgi:hypothetical protein